MCYNPELHTKIKLNKVGLGPFISFDFLDLPAPWLLEITIQVKLNGTSHRTSYYSLNNHNFNLLTTAKTVQRNTASILDGILEKGKNPAPRIDVEMVSIRA